MKNRTISWLTISIIGLTLAFSAPSVAEQVEVQWLGHSATKITSVNGKIIVIDPFLKKNPMVPAKYRDLKSLGKVDLILITHGHFDHARDLPELAKLTGAKVVGMWEYILNLVNLGVLDGDKVITISTGSFISPIGKGIKIAMVPAEHSSSVDLEVLGLKKSGHEAPKFIPGGTAVGFIVQLENGFTIYHAGDTGAFGDMALIKEFYDPDLALVPIGGHFTMDPIQAAYALRKLIKPKKAIPIHYGTFPAINRNPAELTRMMGDSPIEIVVPKPGQAIKF